MRSDHRPNFTGAWQLVPATSRMLGRPVAAMMTTIDHREPVLVQTVVVIAGDGGRQELRCEYRTSGEDSVNAVGAAQLRTRASWHGEELLLESWLAFGERTSHFRYYWRLSDAGDTLTMEHRDDDLAGQLAVLERMPSVIYKIVPAPLWRASEAAGVFTGSPVDVRDGFIHFSTAAQVRDTAARHFAGIGDLLLVAVDADQLDLRWEPSRGGALFPHLYAPLPMTAVRWVRELPLVDGVHLLPDLTSL